MENNKRKLLRKGDAFIIVLLIAAVFIFYALFPENGGETAVIQHNGEVIAELSLKSDGTYTFPQVPDMVFNVSEGTFSVTESGCGDKTCMRTGKISKRGEVVICVPNRIIAEIKGNSPESDVDALI